MCKDGRLIDGGHYFSQSVLGSLVPRRSTHRGEERLVTLLDLLGPELGIRARQSDCSNSDFLT